MSTAPSAAEMQAALNSYTKRPAPTVDYPIDTSLLPTASTSTSEPPTAKKARTTRKKASDAAESDEPKSGKKELKNSKRAEQNRAAQQAFRARKDERMKELEEKAMKLDSLVGQQADLEKLRLELQEREKAISSRERISGSTRQGEQEQHVVDLMDEIRRLREKLQAQASVNDQSNMNTILSQQRDFQSSQLEIKRLNDLLVASRRAEADKDARLDAMRRTIEDISVEARQLRSRIPHDA